MDGRRDRWMDGWRNATLFKIKIGERQNTFGVINLVPI